MREKKERKKKGNEEGTNWGGNERKERKEEGDELGTN